MRDKIMIVGAGNVGASCAAWLAERDLGDIVLVDIPQTENMPKGKALDITQCGPVLGFDTRIVGFGGNNFSTRTGYPYWPCADTSNNGITWP